MQIGAFDGQVADPLADILRLENVSAVLVEPQTIPYKALVAHYEGNPGISLVNAAIAESDGEVILYVPSSRESPKASLIAGPGGSTFHVSGFVIRGISNRACSHSSN